MLQLVLISLWFFGSAVGRPQPCCIPYEHSIVILTYQGTVPIGTANAEIAEVSFRFDLFVYLYLDTIQHVRHK